MLKINNGVIDTAKFPDGTLLMKLSSYGGIVTVTWRYENDAELFTLICIVNHLRELNPKIEISLKMPYIPHARMDRTKAGEDVFTLKYFAQVINSLKFDKVYVLDAHSYVSEALINRVRIEKPTMYINDAIEKVNQKSGSLPTLCFPDEGSMKRYSGLFELPYVFCIKERDWKTGDIKSLSLVGETSEIENKNILIVDDICSKGGTFYYTAKALQEYNPNGISLYVTHCENSIIDGELLNSGLINKVYTTNSLFNKEHPLIAVEDIL